MRVHADFKLTEAPIFSQTPIVPLSQPKRTQGIYSLYSELVKKEMRNIIYEEFQTENQIFQKTGYPTAYHKLEKGITKKRKMSDYSTDLDSRDMETFFSEEKILIKKEDNTDNILCEPLTEVDHILNCENDHHNNFGQEPFSTILPC